MIPEIEAESRMRRLARNRRGGIVQPLGEPNGSGLQERDAPDTWLTPLKLDTLDEGAWKMAAYGMAMSRPGLCLCEVIALIIEFTANSSTDYASFLVNINSDAARGTVKWIGQHWHGDLCFKGLPSPNGWQNFRHYGAALRVGPGAAAATAVFDALIEDGPEDEQAAEAYGDLAGGMASMEIWSALGGASSSAFIPRAWDDEAWKKVRRTPAMLWRRYFCDRNDH